MVGDDECGAFSGMRIGRGNRSTRRKRAPVPLFHHESHKTTLNRSHRIPSEHTLRYHHSLVGIATGWKAGVRIPNRQDFYFRRSVQTGSGAHPAAYPVGVVGEAVDHSRHLVPRLITMELYLHSWHKN
jgi:hypothetical protein